MAKISSDGYRFPASYQGVQVNFCKNFKCGNFGAPGTLHRAKRAPGMPAKVGDYTLVASGKGKPQMKCAICGEIMPFRSNASVVEELERLAGHLAPLPAISCPNHGVPVEEVNNAYARFGKTAAGTCRWRCNESAFSERGKATKRQRMPHKNREVFSLLVNSTSINRLAEITGLDFKTLYGKIEFIHGQCLAFAANRERQLLDTLALPKMYVAVDRQAYVVN